MNQVFIVSPAKRYNSVKKIKQASQNLLVNKPAISQAVFEHDDKWEGGLFTNIKNLKIY